MFELVHRYAPKSPAGRTTVAVILALVGVPALVLGLIGLSGNLASGILFLLVSITTLSIAGQLTRGVVRQANAAPDANPLGEEKQGESTGTPVETLRQRYAEGELSDTEFQQRLDLLLETEEVEQSTAEPEPLTE